MALINCPECGHVVSDHAETCPNCGIRIAPQSADVNNIRFDVTNGMSEERVEENTTTTDATQPVSSVAGVPAQEEPTVVAPTAAAVSSVAEPVKPTVEPMRPAAEPVRPAVESTRPNTYSALPYDDGGYGDGPKKNNKSLMYMISFIVALVICIVAYMVWSNAANEKLEMQRYEEAMLSTNVQDLKDYLVQFNDAPQEHRDSVNARLELLTKEDADWLNTVASGSKKALEEYIKNHPGSLHKGEAENIIDSIDFSAAVRKGTAEAYAEYLKMHSESRHAAEAQEFLDNKKATEATTEEKNMARDVCKRFFQAINAQNEEKLLSTISSNLTSFMGRGGADAQDAVDFMNRLYKDDITNMNWYILDDFKVEKSAEGDGETSNIVAHFTAEQRIERTDETKEKNAKYAVTVEVSQDRKITKFNLKKK